MRMSMSIFGISRMLDTAYTRAYLYSCMMKNRERRKEVGKVFFDLSKYLLTTIAIGSFISREALNIKALIIALAAC